MKKITTLFVLLMFCCISKWTNAQYVPPTHIDGAAPNGILWDSVLTGRTLPVRTSTVGFSGAPGAVMFYDKATGKIGINPNGLSISFIVVTYTSGNINTTANTPGPFIYGGNTTTNAYSPSIGTPRTFPAVTAVAGLPPTTHRARFGGSIGSPIGPSLATTGDANNIASTNGYLNLPWSFGKVVNLDSLIANNQALVDFCNALEQVCIETVESGKMTKDLAVCIHGNKVNHGEHYLYTEEFLDAIDANLQKKLA